MADIGFLAYDHSELVGGNTFYYFRSIFAPAGALESLLVNLVELLEGAEVLGGLLGMPAYFPSIIAEGTNVYQSDGTEFVAPSDLYLIASIESPLAPSVAPDLIDLFSSGTALACYVDVLPTTDLQGNVPDDIDPETYPPNDEENPNWYFPDLEGYEQYTLPVAWYAGGNHTALGLWGVAYDDCEIVAGHIRNHPEMFEYDYKQGYSPCPSALIFSAGSGAGYLRTSCIAPDLVGPYYIYWDSIAYSGSLWASFYAPSDCDPAVWWVDAFLFEAEPAPPSDVILPIVQALALLAVLMEVDGGVFVLFKLLNDLLVSGNEDAADYYINPREIWPFALDSQPFALDSQPFAA